ncbi:hypothetical protein [Pedobacter xixiisoli]|uniref:Fibronectin type-III domain-containing protein n=1 Tax=Pedobacter xixiisoli TaxID=1476464 RepID=A0A285ZQV1_9SPHI|nr:hypothetical protein [Pedobacter xixiisoli]SOD12041.1 hypothetical protein SAMN06297358_0464 [Pedobacter xixiisoli]
MKKLFYILILSVFVFSCKKDSGDDEKIALVSPAKGELCTSGRIVSSTSSTVMFKWAPISGGRDYQITFKNLALGTTESKFIDGSGVYEHALLRNTPYSWQVTAVASNGKTIASETWNFHNATQGDISFAPYAAELISPKKNAILAQGTTKVTLIWKGSDEENDIEEYEVYFGKTITPSFYQNTKETVIDIPIEAGSTYYWKILTKDKKGNISYSDLGIFKTN